MTAQTITSAGKTFTICPEDDYAYAGPGCPACREKRYGWYYAQLDEYAGALEECGALVTIGGEEFIDPAKVPALKGLEEVTLLTVYQGLRQYGYANGLL
jgi:hypothetical protein